MFQSLEELLLQTGMATHEQIEAARISGLSGNIAEVLTEQGVFTQQQYIEIMEFHLGIPHVNLDNYQLNPEILGLLDPELVKRFKAIPVDKNGDRLTVAMSDPEDVVAINDIAMATGCQVIPVIAAKGEIDKAIRQHFTMRESMEQIVEDAQLEEEIDPDDLSLMTDDAPIVRMVNDIIEQAVNDGASDIHIEPRENELIVRFRIDGILHQHMDTPKSTHPLMVSRLKIMGELDIAERRVPQDGRIKFVIDDEACRKHSEVFPNMFINMVEAGEASGALDNVLERMADYFEGQAEIRAKVKSATTYPSFIGVVAVVIVIVLMMTVIPTFAEMFSDYGMELPFITRMMMAVSNAITNYFYIFFPALGAAIFLLMRWSKTTKGRHSIQRLSLKVPKFGPIFRNSAIGRFTRSLSMLVASGVPIMQALEIVARVVDNVEYASAILHARKGVAEGMTLSQGLRGSSHFTPLVLHMLKVGEEAGAMDEMLSKVADFYEAEVKYTVDRLSSIIEPIMILFLAVIVGVILAAIMLPIFSMGDAVNVAMDIVGTKL